MTITVVIPTFQRHQDLKRCLLSLKNQQRQADSILVIAPQDDAISREIASALSSPQVMVTILDSPPGGVRTALNRAIDHCTSDIMVLTDDDSEAYPGWLSRIEQHFSSDPTLGGVGGRDELQYVEQRPELADPPPTDQIGHFRFFGKLEGNHHCPPISDLLETDSLKGVNMALRREALGDLRIDDALRGNFAQVAWELILAFKLRSRGWKLLFDKSLSIRHWLGYRVPEDFRSASNLSVGAYAAYNTTYATVSYGPLFRSLLYLLRNMLVGSRPSPGLFGALYLMTTGDWEAWHRFSSQLPSLVQGLAAGLIGWTRNPHRSFFNWPAARKEVH